MYAQCARTANCLTTFISLQHEYLNLLKEREYLLAMLKLHTHKDYKGKWEKINNEAEDRGIGASDILQYALNKELTKVSK